MPHPALECQIVTALDSRTSLCMATTRSKKTAAAATLSATVLWECEADDGWRPYESAISQSLELAFQSGKPTTAIIVTVFLRLN